MNMNQDVLSGMLIALALVCMGVIIGVLVTSWPWSEESDEDDDGPGDEDEIGPLDDGPLLALDDPRQFKAVH